MGKSKRNAESRQIQIEKEDRDGWKQLNGCVMERSVAEEEKEEGIDGRINGEKQLRKGKKKKQKKEEEGGGGKGCLVL